MRSSRISAERNELSLSYGYFTRAEMYVAVELVVRILPAFHGCLHLRSKAVEMNVKAGIAVGVGYYECVTEAVFSHNGTRDVAIGNGIDAKVYATLGFHVDTAMEMVGSGFAEVARKLYGYVHWRAERECCEQ